MHLGWVQQHCRASGSSALNPANALWNVALGLAAPLLNRDALDADVKIATTQQEAAVAAYAQAALTAFTDVENALSQRTNCERSARPSGSNCHTSEQGSYVD